MNPLITVITVCFNSEKTIERTLKSVLDQTYKNFEYIIVDGGSTDTTLEIVKKYEPQFQGKMKVLSEKDDGIYDAMNKGIKMASGVLIGIVNSDDYYEADALSVVAEHYSGEKYTIIYGMVRLVSDGKEIMVYMKNHKNIKNAMIAHPACFISKDVYHDYGLYSLEYPYSADYEFMLRIAKYEDIKYIEVYKILSNFSTGGASSTSNGYRDTLRLKRNYNLISKKYYRFELLKSKINKLFRK